MSCSIVTPNEIRRRFKETYSPMANEITHTHRHHLTQYLSGTQTQKKKKRRKMGKELRTECVEHTHRGREWARTISLSLSLSLSLSHTHTSNNQSKMQKKAGNSKDIYLIWRHNIEKFHKS
jgi:truncated hemoglobin YjbI